MKPNYFTIHKNKAPKRLFKRKETNPFPLYCIVQALSAINDVRVINSQKMDKQEKQKMIADRVIATANNILGISKRENIEHFKRTGRYKKNRKLTATT